LVCIYNERSFSTRNGSVIHLREPDSHLGLSYPNSEEKRNKKEGKKERKRKSERANKTQMHGKLRSEKT
jgi:hypothetical protein